MRNGTHEQLDWKRHGWPEVTVAIRGISHVKVQKIAEKASFWCNSGLKLHRSPHCEAQLSTNLSRTHGTDPKKHFNRIFSTLAPQSSLPTTLISLPIARSCSHCRITLFKSVMSSSESRRFKPSDVRSFHVLSMQTANWGGKTPPRQPLSVNYKREVRGFLTGSHLFLHVEAGVHRSKSNKKHSKVFKCNLEHWSITNS